MSSAGSADNRHQPPVYDAGAPSQPHPDRSRARFFSIRAGEYSLRVERRAAVVGGILLVASALVAVAAMMFGDYPLSAPKVVSALFGASDDRLATYFVQELRAPRAAAALGVGAALGVAGCIFQQLTQNPLGSPDITGFNVGAATGAVVQIIVFNGGPLAVAMGALVGGFVTGAVVYLLARGPGLSGNRFVLIGIGVSFILQGVNSLLVVRADLAAAQTAAQWLAGTFNASTWEKTAALLVALAVLLSCALLLSRPLGAMMAGDDLAIGLGVRTERRRIELIAIGVILVAVTVAVAGPIAFVALAAPQLARRLSRTAGVGMGSAALMGALLVLTSDVIAQRLFAPTQLPVGVVTGTLGGAYLIWLLASEWKKGRP